MVRSRAFPSFVVVILLAFVLIARGGAVAHADPPAGDLSSVQLRSQHSGRCLGTVGRPFPCWPDVQVAIDVVAGTNQAMLRSPFVKNSCLVVDEHGSAVPGDCRYAVPWELMGDGDRRMLRYTGGDQCLYSNADGRYGIYKCVPANDDQWWYIRRPSPTERVRLRSLHSGRCLDVTAAGPTTTPCDGNPGLTLKVVGQEFTIGRDGQCIYANADGRFGSFACADAHADHRWNTHLTGRESRALWSVHAGKCIYANRDGRFGIFTCNRHEDQDWELLLPPVPPPPVKVPTTPLPAWAVTTLHEARAAAAAGQVDVARAKLEKVIEWMQTAP